MGQIDVGLIETIRVRQGEMPFLRGHLARLERSLAALGRPAPARDLAALIRPFREMGEAVVRVEVRNGDAAVTIRELPALAPPDVITAAQPYVPYPHKTTDRDPFDEALAEAVVAEADDALLLTTDGLVAEGTTWSVFWWEVGRLRTPALDVGILPGVGRARVMGLAAVEEGRFKREGLVGRSAFLTNAVRGVVPLGALDGVAVPPDARTAELAARFWPAD